MLVARSIALIVVAALFEIGGAWLVRQGAREHLGWLWIGAGVSALGWYGLVATFQPDAHFRRVLSGYGRIFVAGAIAWGRVADGNGPDRHDLTGAAVCLADKALTTSQGRAFGTAAYHVTFAETGMRHTCNTTVRV